MLDLRSVLDEGVAPVFPMAVCNSDLRHERSKCLPWKKNVSKASVSGAAVSAGAPLPDSTG